MRVIVEVVDEIVGFSAPVFAEADEVMIERTRSIDERKNRNKCIKTEKYQLFIVILSILSKIKLLFLRNMVWKNIFST